MVVAAVLLAAGEGSRFRAGGPGPHKLLADLGGTSLFARSLANVVASAIGPVVVVTGAAPVEVPAGLREGPAGPVVTVTNEHWSEGQASSLAVAIEAADRLGADAVVIGLADQPSIDPAAWRAVASAPPQWQVVVASYDGRRGPHPVRLHRSVWAALPQTGDDGARTLMREHPDLVQEVECPGSATDIDTLEDLQRWTSS